MIRRSARRTASGRGHAISSFFVFCLIALFAVLSTLLTLFGIRAYRSVYAASAANSEAQTVLSYLINKAHSGDRAGSVSVRVIDGMDVLCIAEPLDDGLYETRVFAMDGNLCEYFCEAGEAFDPELGSPLVAIQSLRLTMEQPWLIRVDIGREGAGNLRASIALRGEESP